MISTPDSHILFFIYSTLIVGAGLFYARNMGLSFDKYFLAEKSTGTIVMGITLFMVLFLNAIVLILPGMPYGNVTVESVLIVIVASISPVLLIFNLPESRMTFFESIGTGVKRFLLIHGIFFTAIIQMLVLLRATDFILSQFLTGTYFGIQVVMLMGAGMYTLIGGLKSVLYVNLIVGIGAIATILFLIFNALYFHQPLLFSFSGIVITGSNAFQLNGTSESNIVVAAIGISIAMTWILMAELSGFYRLTSSKSTSTHKKSILFASVIFVVVCSGLLLVPDHGSISDNGFLQTFSLANSFVALGLFGGLLGMFALVFHAVSVIIASHFFQDRKKPSTDEKSILIGRLATVVTVILSILMVSFGKTYGNSVVEWYIIFLTYFTTPIVTVFLLSLVIKKGMNAGILSGLLIGEGFALVEFVFFNGQTHALLFGSTSGFAFSIDIAVVTSVAGIVSSKVHETVLFQKFLLSTGVSRPIKRA